MKTTKLKNQVSKSTNKLSAAISAVVAMAAVSATINAAVLEEVVVTAQKRQQDLSDVSVAVTAFTGNMMRELNMTNSVDIASQTPGLNIGTPVGEGNNPSITLRGVGLNDFNDNNEGPIAIYRDDVYQSAMAGLTFQLFDLERVEVLRGPQGTLYGRNATGGLVHFISNKPSSEFGGYADLTIAEYDQVKFEGAIGGGLGESVQARLSIAANQHDGYVENRVGPDANEADSLAYRLQLNFDVTDSLSLLLNVHGGESDVIAPKYQHQVTDAGGVDVFGYIDTDGDNFAGDYDRDGVLNIESEGASLTLNWEGDSFSLTSITAVESVDKIHEEDTDTGPVTGLAPTFQADIEQFSQEFRLSGSNDKLTWVAGAYYFDSEADNQLDLVIDHFNGFIDFLDTLPEADGGFGGGLSAVTGADFTSDPGALSPFLTYDVDYTQETESAGVFGQAEFAFSDQFTLVMGLRYTSEERSFNYANIYGDRNGNGVVDNGDGVLNSFLNTVAAPEYFLFVGDIDNDNISGKVGVDFRPTDDTLIFANYSRGFKSGGFNGGFLDFTDGILPENTPYDEEILNSYEVGIKTSFADGAVRINATAFYYDYQDYQALTFSGLSQFITNSDAELNGVEIELVWQPDENWDMQLGGSWLETEVDSVMVQGVVVTGTEMVLAPEFTLNGLVRYEIPMGDTSAVAVQLDFNHQADHFFDITNSPVSKEDAYTLVNARVSYRLNESLSFAAWGKNLTDEEYRVYTFDFTGPAGFNQQFFAPPRWFGVSANYEF